MSCTTLRARKVLSTKKAPSSPTAPACTASRIWPCSGMKESMGSGSGEGNGQDAEFLGCAVAADLALTLAANEGAREGAELHCRAATARAPVPAASPAKRQAHKLMPKGFIHPFLSAPERKAAVSASGGAARSTAGSPACFVGILCAAFPATALHSAHCWHVRLD